MIEKFDMIKYFFKSAFRNLANNKTTSIINICGLAIGIACSLIIVLFIFHHLSYDKFNENKDRIYRLIRSGTTQGKETDIAYTPAVAGPAMLYEFPEVEDFTRIHTEPEIIVRYQEKYFIENSFIAADSSFFNIFSVTLLAGDKNTALKEAGKLVLSESTAKKIFGNSDPMNKLLTVGSNEIPYTVAAIMADIPESSHFHADIIGSYVTNPNINDNNWGHITSYTYLLLKPGSKPEHVNDKLQDFYLKYNRSLFENAMGISVEKFFAQGNKRGYYLQPLEDIHLNSFILHSLKPSYNIKYLVVFGSIAILIVLIASINFMILSTALGIKRAKEVGIKKVCGSSRAKLVRQFLTESALLSFVALVLAIFMVENTLPLINNLLGIKLEFDLFNKWHYVPVLLGFAIIVGMLSGSYPALYLSSFTPYSVLKEKLNPALKNVRLRSILVVIQFSITIVLIIGTFVMLRQIRFMINRNPGFNSEQLLVISRAEALGSQLNTFKNELLKTSGVLNVSTSTHIPGHSENGSSYSMEGHDGDFLNLTESHIDYDFFDTYDMKLASGRVFDEKMATDMNACILNESAVKQFGMTDPLNAAIVGGRRKFSVIGVVKNFHFESLHNEIRPYIFRIKNDEDNYGGYISIRLSDEASNTIHKIEKLWYDFVPYNPLQYFYLDQDFAKKYKDDWQNAYLSALFSMLAIIVAALGLLGLTSYSVEKRTKEIGIRKTMGASGTGILYLISKEILLLVSVAILISWPLIYFVSNNWLQNFYYRINLQLMDFLAGSVIVLIITLMTISYRAIQSARTNPVEALRYE
ncbi:MAG: ABC transporter permease [Bacteroidales bacterium]|nr:ABC transporter permease [Bacteroidales bacterium]